MRFIALAVLLVLSKWVFAVDTHQLATTEQQQIYENLTAELRCLVCQNQTIGDSNAELAADLRRQIYEMLQQGKSKQQIVDFMTERYGDFVLYKPPFKAKTSLLWLGPGLFLLIGMIAITLVICRKKRSPAFATVDIKQQANINRLLEEGDDS